MVDFSRLGKVTPISRPKKGCVHPINEKHACIVLNAKEDLMTYKAGIISQFLNSSALFAYNCRYNSHLNKLLNAENLFLFFFFG